MGLKTQTRLVFYVALPLGFVVIVLLTEFVHPSLSFLIFIELYLLTRFLRKMKCPNCGLSIRKWDGIDNVSKDRIRFEFISKKCPRCGEEFD